MTNTKEITKEKIMEAFHFRHACKEFDPTQNFRRGF